MLVRMYVQWSGAASSATAAGQVAELAAAPVSWDLVLAYRDADAET